MHSKDLLKKVKRSKSDKFCVEFLLALYSGSYTKTEGVQKKYFTKYIKIK